MVGSFYKRGDFAWVQDVRANYVCIHNGELVATVFSTAWAAMASHRAPPQRRGPSDG
jgi:hypothetical protein